MGFKGLCVKLITFFCTAAVLGVACYSIYLSVITKDYVGLTVPILTSCVMVFIIFALCRKDRCLYISALILIVLCIGIIALETFLAPKIYKGFAEREGGDKMKIYVKNSVAAAALVALMVFVICSWRSDADDSEHQGTF